jgi:hypothetical protein
MTAATNRRRYAAALAILASGMTAALVFLGTRQFIGYDSYLHIFIARQDRWPNFWREVRDNTHPPLFYLLLRVTAAWLGPRLLTYRVVSIAATVYATGLIAAIVRRTTANRALAIVAAAAFGFSYSTIMMGLDVRAYALWAAFTLLAFVFYLNWIGKPTHRLSKSTYGGFAIAATAAVVTHYSTFFFLAAAIATPMALALVSRGWRRRVVAKVSARPAATFVMFAAPAVTAAAAYVVHAGLWGGINYVPDYMFVPALETPWRFVLRNTLNLTAILLPGGNPTMAGIHNWRQQVALVVIGGVSVAGLVRVVRASVPCLAAVPLVMTAVLLALNVVGGLTHRYPYGGAARHEFFLVPFVVVGFFNLLEAARRGLPEPYRSRKLWVSVLTGGVALNVASWTSDFRIESQPPYQAQITRFRALIASPHAVLLDQFSLINFFSHHHDWKWRAAGEWDGQAVRQVWSVSKGGRTMVVCRDAEWSLDMSKIEAYDSVVECGQRSGVRRVAVFRTQWELQQPAWDTTKTDLFVNTLAGQDGLKPTALGADDGNVYAEFDVDPARRDACSAPPSRPADLRVVSNSGRVVVLSWAPAGGERASYIIEAGRTTGRTDVLNMRLGRATTYTAAQVNPGTYYARVRARNLCGLSEASDDIRVLVP